MSKTHESAERHHHHRSSRESEKQHELSRSVLDVSSADKLKDLLHQASSEFTREKKGKHKETLEIPNIGKLLEKQDDKPKEETVKVEEPAKPEVDAQKVEEAVDQIHKACDGVGTDEDAVFKALEGKSEAEIRAMKARYQEKYGVKLDAQLKSELEVPMLGDTYGDWAKAKTMLEHRDPIDLNEQRAKLDETAKKRMSASEYEQFQKDMKAFDARKGQDGLTDEEIARTYREVNRLLEAGGEKPLNPTQRKYLAMQVVENAADPTHISQGSNNTCNVTTVETSTYRKAPSEAARLVTDVALTSQYITRAGDVVPMDPSPRTNASNNYPPRIDGARVHASEIFEITAVNVAYTQDGIKRRYDQATVPPPQNQTDNGERLYDTTKNPPEEVLNGEGKPVRSPDLATGQLVDVAKTISGRDDIGAISSSYAGDDPRVQKINSEEELNQKLAEAKANGKLPIIIHLNTEVEPFWGDSGHGAAGGSGGAHVVTVTDYEPGPPAKVNIDNQWNNSDDYQGDKKMSVHDLYKTMLSNADATKEVQKEVDQARADVRVDVFKETDLLRMKKMSGQISEEDYQSEFRDLICRTKEDFSKRGDAVTDEERLQARVRFEQIIANLPQEKRNEFYTYLREAQLQRQTEAAPCAGGAAGAAVAA